MTLEYVSHGHCGHDQFSHKFRSYFNDVRLPFLIPESVPVKSSLTFPVLPPSQVSAPRLLPYFIRLLSLSVLLPLRKSLTANTSWRSTTVPTDAFRLAVFGLPLSRLPQLHRISVIVKVSWRATSSYLVLPSFNFCDYQDFLVSSYEQAIPRR